MTFWLFDASGNCIVTHHASMSFLFDTIGMGVAVMGCHCISVNIMWSGQHHQWHNCTS